MRSKVASLLLVVLMVLASFVPAFAQSEPFCGDLDPADCDLLTVATENMTGGRFLQGNSQLQRHSRRHSGHAIGRSRG
jgi:hypothetical protein